MADKESASTQSKSISQLAREAAEKVREWLRTGDGEVDGQAINEVSAIIEQVLTASDLYRAGVEAAATLADANGGYIGCDAIRALTPTPLLVEPDEGKVE